MATETNKKTTFSTDEEARIQAEVDAYEKKRREDAIQTEIQIRIFDAQRKKPGHRYT